MKLLVKLTAVLLVLALLVSTGFISAFAEETGLSEEAVSYYKGAYYYCPGSGVSSENADRMDVYVYSDDYFRAPSSEYNAHLATMSMALSEASASSARSSGYTRQSRNLSALLEDIGFTDFAVNNDYQVKPTVSTSAVACAHKQIVDGGKSYTLLAVVPRSAGYGAEWGSNVLFDAKGDASGYSAAANTALAFVKKYIADYGLQGEIKLWTAGYDRGAAVAMLAAKSLIDNPTAALGTAVTLSPENLYAYTFGTPAAADSKQNPSNAKYSMIYHHISDTDILAALPPVQMGFGRYGTVKTVNVKANKKRMKQLLAVCNPDVYKDYVGENHNPDAFAPKRATSSFSIVTDTNSYIPADAREYLTGLSKYLTVFTGGRSGYSSETEQPLSAVLTYYGGLTSDKANTFTESVVNNKDTINGIISMYAYFLKLKSSGAVLNSAQTQKAASELAAVSDSSSDFTDKELYELLLRLLRYKSSSAATILSDAASYLKSTLTAAMKASGATTSQINSVTTTNNMKALSRFMACLFFGNIWQSDEVDPYSFTDSEQIKNAMTLLENYKCLAADHRSEVMKSWLRAADSYYDDYAAMTEAQSAGYRRVSLTADVSGEVFNAAGEKVARISGGVLADSGDCRLGYTSSDNGGFLRIPGGETYKIVLRPDAEGPLGITVGEYDCKTAQTAAVLTKELTVSAQTVITVELPADGECTVTTSEPCILGDANGDGRVNISDVTAIQRHLAEIDLLSGAALFAADVNGDNAVTIDDATALQNYLAEFDTAYPVGEPVAADF